MNYQLDIQIKEPFGADIEEAWLRRAVEETLRAEGIESSVELGLVIADEELVHELNRKYRGIDEGTDVLSFPLREGDTPFVTPPDSPTHLGEVIVSYPHAVRQSREQEHSLEQELAHLVIHGVLHLLGYDDEDREGEEKMRIREKKILKSMAGGTSYRD